MAFITDQELKDYLKGVLQTNADLDATWDVIVPQANLSAYGYIVEAWMKRGYTKAQVDQWDRGIEYNKSIGVWWCLEMRASMDPTSVSAPHLERFKLDRRWELSDRKGQDGMAIGGGPMMLITNGVFVRPGTKYGQPTVGKLNTDDDLFVLDPDDPRRGHPTIL